MKRGNSRGAKGPCRPNCFIRSKEIRLDTRPTTEEHGGLIWDQPMDQPEEKSVILASDADMIVTHTTDRLEISGPIDGGGRLS